MTEILITDDGTATLFLDEYGQAMHSTSGAYEEALLKHVQPSGITEKQKESLSVLDIGFGLGYNILALMDMLRPEKNRPFINVLSLEKDRGFCEYLNSVKFDDYRDLNYSIIRQGYRDGSVKSENMNLELLFGDARETLKQITDIKFDAVFQDPFSPSKNPELWSVEYFQALSELMDDDCILTTYSSADHVRMAMTEAGLHIGKGPSVGQKREGTLAARTKVFTTLDDKKIWDIRGNPKSEPYRDPGLNLPRERIINNRLDSIRSKKITGCHQAHQV